MEEVRCKKCNHILTNKLSISRGMGDTCYRIHRLLQEANKPEKPDMKEIKTFISSEIVRIFKEFNFNKPINNTESLGILPKKITKIPIFNPFESDKRLVIKDLKEQLEVMVTSGIKSVLQEVGSFDTEINFLEVPIGISA